MLPKGWNFNQAGPGDDGSYYCYHQNESNQGFEMCFKLQSSSLRAFSVFHSIEFTNSSSV